MTDLNVGEIANFNVKAWHDWAFELCKCDEFQRALWVLDNGPGYYRDNPPEEIKALKKKILHGFMTTHDYTKNQNDEIVALERGQAINGSLRGIICKIKVQAWNAEGKIPHIVDMGPGEYWLACGLHNEGLKFTYEGICLNDVATHKAKELVGQYFQKGAREDQPVIFNACEIIEHLWNPYEIKQTYYKFGGRADMVLMSTPKYTFGQGSEKWDDPKEIGLLGHLTTYTPKEFIAEAEKMFPEYAWEFVVAEYNTLEQKFYLQFSFQFVEPKHKMLNEILMLVGKPRG